MRLRNNIFAAAFDYLKREKGIKTQKRLAEMMGVSEDTITRILKDRCEVTEDIITKLQTASGCIFNLQWLRGEDAFHMLAGDVVEDFPEHDDVVSIKVALAAKDEIIAELRGRVADLRQQVEDLRQQVEDLRQQLADERAAKKEHMEFLVESSKKEV